MFNGLKTAVSQRIFHIILAKPDLMAKPQQRPEWFFVDENIDKSIGWVMGDMWTKHPKEDPWDERYIDLHLS